MDSPDSAFAAEAVCKLVACGWGFGNDRSLDRVNFQAADLESANPEGANLENAKVSGEHLNKKITLGDVRLPDGNIYDG